MKLIAIDMDGTLLTKRLEITPANLRAIQLAQEQHITVVIATGRPYAWAQRKLAEAGLQCPIIGSNGAELFSLGGERLSTHPLSGEQFAILQELLEQEKLYYEVYTNRGIFTENPDGAIALRMTDIRSSEPHLSEAAIRAKAEERFARSTIIPVRSYSDVTNKSSRTPDMSDRVETYKLLTCSYDRERLLRCKTALQSNKALAISSSAANNLEITNIAAQKGYALQRLAQHMGIELCETAAIGDNHNDLQMLQMAGVAIAMGNAHESIKSVCHHTTLSHEESGVAHAIEHFCLSRTSGA
ncbi:Cof-type HAD-IIB family hydrolase [Paenibacillus sp. UNC451MF]|uniref:Cof-type HAD-IIB family hydrolase n=1 Tax=Paenibacillus sp. UNC451MF TaxID=1449063 RepID=UPI00048B8CBE|nr:Cof-type HAD-IIB family hydrolase [Paenibacillus sp. UNC451MF]